MEITSLHNPLVKQLRLLGRSAKERRLTGSFLLEGTHALTEALQCAYPLQLVGATELWQKKHSLLWQQVLRQGVKGITFSPHVMEAIATVANPEGVVAVGTIQPRAVHLQSFGLALWQIQDPGNMGTLIRTAVAVGVDGILLSDSTVDITNPKILRATAGQWFRCAMTTVANLQEWLQTYQRQGWQVVATSAQGEHAFWQWDFLPPTILLLGNEGNGLTADLLRLADGVVRVPVAQGVESLNVAIAGSLLMYEVLRQRSYGGQGVAIIDT
jgi:TrmH family RNA methyltransferase